MRMRMELDRDWKFFLGDLPPHSPRDQWGGAKAKAFDFGACAMNLDDSNWKSVILPHDFVMEGSYVKKSKPFDGERNIPAMETIDNRHVAGGSLEGGVAWYRRKIRYVEEATKRVYLHFEGVFQSCELYLNEYYVGSHQGGYTGFHFDITDFLREEGEQYLAVRVDAREREGWWYEGGGIYRQVWLEEVADLHLRPWGLRVEAIPISKQNVESAHVIIEAELVSLKSMERVIRDQEISIEIQIRDQENKVCLSREFQVDEKADIQRFEMDIEGVRCWHIDDPYLYEVTLLIKGKNVCNGDDNNEFKNEYKVIDQVKTRFGVRSLRFDVNQGFFLNEKRVKIKGICAHHDHAGVGIGVPKSILRYRLKKIQEMGANAYRCSHNPPSQELLDLCDEMGILVLDEIRNYGSAKENLEQLHDFVKRDRNHPSIFLWSIGNEEVFAQESKEAGKMAATMVRELKKLDPTRLSTLAFCCFNGKEKFHSGKSFIPVSKEVDVMGFNYAPEAWEEYHELMPEQPMLITEATANSGTRGAYESRPLSSEYFILDPKNQGKAMKLGMAEKEWKLVAESDYLSGIFLWTAFDYRGEPTPFSYPAILSQFGVMDYCGFPKDNFYYYQSWWQEEPVLHLFPHWNHRDKIGQKITVYAYSNMDEVELFVNGVSQGKKSMERNGYLQWDEVVYAPGVLSAKGYKDQEVILEEQIRTTKAAHHIEVRHIEVHQEAETLLDDEGNVLIYEVRVVDEDGLVVPTDDSLLRFRVEGEGEFLGAGNGNPASHEEDKVPMRRAFRGLCQVLVRKKTEHKGGQRSGENGEIQIFVEGGDLIGRAIVTKIIN